VSKKRRVWGSEKERVERRVGLFGVKVLQKGKEHLFKGGGDFGKKREL